MFDFFLDHPQTVETCILFFCAFALGFCSCAICFWANRLWVLKKSKQEAIFDPLGSKRQGR
jgi:hypothetical protein